VSPKRGDRVAAPPVADEWDLRFGSNPAASGWEELCRTVAGNARRCFEDLRASPTPRPESGRQHRLKHEYKERSFGGKILPQWQYEVTGGGRVWYLVDDHKRIIWITYAGTGHPKATD
jgi:hypothetical protein